MFAEPSPCGRYSAVPQVCIWYSEPPSDGATPSDPCHRWEHRGSKVSHHASWILPPENPESSLAICLRHVCSNDAQGSHFITSVPREDPQMVFMSSALGPLLDGGGRPERILSDQTFHIHRSEPDGKEATEKQRSSFRAVRSRNGQGKRGGQLAALNARRSCGWGWGSARGGLGLTGRPPPAGCGH